MKKIFAILISLLFVASVFGVAQTMAQVPCPCDEEYYKINRDSVKVGETFTISLTKIALLDCPNVRIEGKSIDEVTGEIVANGGFPYRIGPVDMIGVEYYDAEGNLIYSGLVLPDCGYGFPCWSGLYPDADWGEVEWITWTFRAVTPGTLDVTNNIPCLDVEKVTVLSKSLPMDWILKKFGLGRYKN